MTEQEERELIVNEAKTWLGTPYRHHGDIKGSGVDCGMLLVRCFVDTGLVPPFDPRPYSRDWHLHRSEERYLGFVGDRTREVVYPLPGDLVVFKVGRVYSHGGICVEWPNIIHASAPSRMVIEENCRQGRLMKRDYKAYSFWTGK